MFKTLPLITITFASGIIFGRYISFPMTFLAMIIFILVLINSILLFNNSKSLIPLLLLIAFLGVFVYNLALISRQGNVIEFTGKDITLVGRVSDEPQLEKDRSIYTVDSQLLEINNSNYKVNGTLNIIIRDNQNNNLYYGYGDTLKLQGVIYSPETARNPGGFNYRNYLLSKGISGTMYVREHTILEEGPFTFRGFLYIVKTNIINTIYNLMPDIQASVLVGMLFGIRQNIPLDIVESFTETGIVHILAVSGLHVGFISMLIYTITKSLGLRVSIRILLTAFFMLVYIIMTGGRPSILRASIMLIISLIGKEYGRDKDFLTSISIAAIIILLLNPISLFSQGFQLSFAATTAIIVLYEPFCNLFKFLGNKASQLLAVSTSAQLGVLPLTAYYFNYISLVFMLSNIVIVPLVGIVIILGFLTAFFGILIAPIGLFFGSINTILITIILHINDIIARIPFSSISVFAPLIAFIIIYYSLLFITAKKDKVVIALLILFPLFTCISYIGYNPFTTDNLKVTFIDVGQGDSILITTPKNRNILIDGGGIPDFHETKLDIGKDILLPFFQKNRINKLDMIIISHIHDDHIKGLIPLFDVVPVGIVVLGQQWTTTNTFENLLYEINKHEVPMLNLSEGDYFYVDDSIEFIVLHPPEKPLLNTGSDLNNNSLVIKKNYKDISFLYTGDIEMEGEKELLNKNYSLYSHVLKVGHHGSRTSTSKDFLNKVRPKYAIISAGRNNLYGHPHQETLDRLLSNDVIVFRTDKDGAVIFETDGYSFEITTMLNQEEQNGLSKIN